MNDEKIPQTYFCVRRSSYRTFFQVGHQLIDLENDIPISREDGEKKAMEIAMSINFHLKNDRHHISSTFAIFPNDKKGRQDFLNYAIAQDDQDVNESGNKSYEENARLTLRKCKEESC